MADSDMQRSNGEPEEVRRSDGGGERAPLPGSDTARGNAQAPNQGADRGVGAETWKPGEDETGIRPGSPAAEAFASGAPADAPAEPDSDEQSRNPIPQPASAEPRSASGADAPSHGSR